MRTDRPAWLMMMLASVLLFTACDDDSELPVPAGGLTSTSTTSAPPGDIGSTADDGATPKSEIADDTSGPADTTDSHGTEQDNGTCNSEVTVSDPVAPQSTVGSDDPQPPPEDFEAPPRGDAEPDDCPDDP